LWLIGASFNLMTLGGLAAAIGLVIDDAIVVVENVVMHRDNGETRTDAVRKALSEITVPLLGSTITPFVVFVPLIATSLVTGPFSPRPRHYHGVLAPHISDIGAYLDPRPQPCSSA